MYLNDIKIKPKVIITGNHKPCAEQILGALGYQAEGNIHEMDRVQKGTLMVSTHGVFHGDSYHMTKKAFTGTPFFKISIDGHADFGSPNPEEYPPYDFKHIQHLYQEAKAKVPRSKKERILYESHMIRAYNEELISGFAIMGLSEIVQIEQVSYMTDTPMRDTPTSFDMMTPAQALPARHDGPIHLTIDVDAIWQAEFVRTGWRNNQTTAPHLNDIVEFIEELKALAEIELADIVGFNPETDDLSSPADREGLKTYGTLIETIQR